MKNYHRLTISAAVLCVAVLSGCAGATRLPTRAKGPEGQALQNKQLDLTFLDASGTRREEVLNRLNSVDTTYSNPRLFWGRWSESKWGYWWFIVGNNTAAGDAKRIWHTHNLLVSFDENGLVRKKGLFDEDKSLWAELHNELADAPPLDFSQPIQMEVIGPGKLRMITLGKDPIEFDLQKGKVSHFQVSPQAIVRISHSRLGILANHGMTCHTLHLAEKSPLGKRILFCASPANVATIFQYLGQAGSPTMRWD
jgi:hypothetical protein